MFYQFLYPLAEKFAIFNVFRYITVRSAFAFVTSFVLILLLWKVALPILKKLKYVEKIDMWGHVHLEALHEEKIGTPTMGGILIILAVLLTVILWSRWDSRFVWWAVTVMMLLGAVGFRDDFLKVHKGKGIQRREKLLSQIAVGIFLGAVMIVDKNVNTTLSIPFFKNIVWDLGYFYIFWVMFVIVSTSNAVNFTDGLDGLAIGAVIITCTVFAFLSYLVGNFKFTEYLLIPFVSGAGELTILCAAIVGASLGFLWYNSHPAQVFMGDVGALAIGGVIGAIAIFIKKEFLLIFAGGLFVIEAVTVVLQIISCKFFNKRIFKAAPLHHHLQLLGWKESKIVIRLWIIAVLCAVFSLMTLKLR